MLLGYLEWAKAGLLEPESVLMATREYRAEEDLVGQYVEEYCETGPNLSIGATALYGNFKLWRQACLDKSPLSQRAFGLGMSNLGFHSKKTGGVMVYRGICLKTQQGLPPQPGLKSQ
jgi:putative DNA primase/helicase